MFIIVALLVNTQQQHRKYYEVAISAYFGRGGLEENESSHPSQHIAEETLYLFLRGVAVNSTLKQVSTVFK